MTVWCVACALCRHCSKHTCAHLDSPTRPLVCCPPPSFAGAGTFHRTVCRSRGNSCELRTMDVTRQGARGPDLEKATDRPRLGGEPSA